MRNKLENFHAPQKSTDSLESVKPVVQNLQDSHFKQRRKNYDLLQEQDKQNADIFLDNKLKDFITEINTSDELIYFLREEHPNNQKAAKIASNYYEEQKLLGLSISSDDLRKHVSNFLDKQEDISIAGRIKNFKEQLSQQGKSSKDILQILITKYEEEKAVRTWVDNWKNYLKLRQFAETKSPEEKQEIQSIISKADFTNENAFSTSLLEISNSSEISQETKQEIFQKFNTKNISTVGALDTTLKQIKSRNREIEKMIDTKKGQKVSLESDLETLEAKLQKMPFNDPRRYELEAELHEKNQLLNKTESEINKLEREKPKEVLFQLRDGFKAKLKSNGTRLILIEDMNFNIQLPDNNLFMGHKNLLSVNLAFSFKAFSQIGMDMIFSPKLKNGEVPDKQQRIFGSQILQNLGYKTDQILSQSDISQLEKDISHLKQKGRNTSGVEDLELLGIWNVSRQEVNTCRLNSCLNFIRRNRDRKIIYKDVREQVVN